MKHKTICAVVIVLILTMMMGSINSLSVKAADAEELAKTLEEEEKFELGKAAKAVFNKLLSAFKKIGSLSAQVAKTVKLYNNLDPEADDYPDRMDEFLESYNSLGPINRKLVDAVTNLISAKDSLVSALRRFQKIDLYSVKYLESSLEGELTYSVGNETICEVEEDGLAIPVGVGVTRVVVTNDSGEKETLKVIVSKPLLSRSIRVSRNKTCQINVQSDINDIVVSNNCISYTLDGSTLSIYGESKGTAYIYVGSTTGRTTKYKIKVS